MPQSDAILLKRKCGVLMWLKIVQFLF